MRVVIERAGETQYTRWLSPYFALGDVSDLYLKKEVIAADTKEEEQISDTLELRWSSINTAGFIVFFRYLAKEVDHSLQLEYYRAMNSSNLKYFDLHEVDLAECDRPKVAPKLVHPFVLSVECRKLPQNCSAFEGEKSDIKQVDASLEKVFAYYTKGMSMVSTLFKGIVKKNSVDTKEDNHLEHGTNDSSKINRNNDFVVSDLSSCLYISDTAIDPSEAYNAVGGKHRFSLRLRPSKAENIGRKEGVPIVLNFTMVAHFKEAINLPIRDFHSMVILLDQIVLDVTNAQKSVNNEGNLESKTVEAYAIGLTSDISRTTEYCIQTPFMAPRNTSAIEEDKLMLVDFYLLHPTQNERELTELDMKSNPTSFCIVSSECKTLNKKRIGNRAIMVSRFKTADDGVCKSSYKCQLHFGLLRCYNNGEIEIDRCTRPIDISQIINQEHYFDKTSTIVFSHGECMNFRLRRRCFVRPEHHSCELLMPFDYDNTGIKEDDLDCNSCGDEHISSCLELTDKTSLKENIEKDDNENNNNSYVETRDDCKGEERRTDDCDINVAGDKKATANTEHIKTESAEKAFVTQLLIDGALSAFNSYENEGYGLQEEISETTEAEEEEEEEKEKETIFSVTTEKPEIRSEFMIQTNDCYFIDNNCSVAHEFAQENLEATNFGGDKDNCNTFISSNAFLHENVASRNNTTSNLFEFNPFEIAVGASQEKNTKTKDNLPVINF